MNDKISHYSKRLSLVSNSPRLDAELLLAYVLATDRSQLLARTDLELSDSQQRQLTELVNRRVNGEPIAYITGSIEFYGLTLAVDGRVLCPRPETEQLVERVVGTLNGNESVVDVGTGSGAVAAAIKSSRPELNVTATDVDPAALEVAGANFERLRLSIDTYQSDLLEQVGEVDTVVANLPYLPESRPLDPSVRHEPESALLSGSDGLDHYRRVFAELAKRSDTKNLYIEAEPSQQSALVELAAAAGYELIWQQNYSYHFRRVD